MKKILSLLAFLALMVSNAIGGEVFTFDFGTSGGTATPSDFFTHSTDKWSFNTKYKDATYGGKAYTMGLKLENGTWIGFTNAKVAKVTIVQATNTQGDQAIKFDDVEIPIANGVNGTNYREYILENVGVGEHKIARSSKETGLFLVKVEYPSTVTFINDANWAKVNVWAWNQETNENFTGGVWPGQEMTEKDNDENYTWTTFGNPTHIIFNDGTAQTVDLEFKDGGKYNSTGRIIELNEYTASFKSDGMTEAWAYAWNGDDKPLGEWPGTKMTAEGDGFSITIKAEEAPKYIIFHDNQGNQTTDLAFEDGKAYEFNQNDYTATFTTDAEWTTVYAYAWTTTGEGEAETTKEFVGAWPGTALTGTDGVYNFSLKSFYAPQMIQFNDGKAKTSDLAFTDGKAYKWITATPTYALTEGATFASGTTVDVKDGDDVVATLTYGVEGGDAFLAAIAQPNEDYAGFTAYTPGNGVNGASSAGTVYIIKPKYDGTITVGVRLNGGKSFFIEEDGTAMADYNGITIPDAANTSYSFAVKAGSTYNIYCTGSKLGFFGFDYQFTNPALNDYSVSFTTDRGWEKVYAYAWSGEGENVKEFSGTWPGKEITGTLKEGVYTYEFQAAEAPAFIIFNNGLDGDAKDQTEDLAFEDKKTYEFNKPAEQPTENTETIEFTAAGVGTNPMVYTEDHFTYTFDKGTGSTNPAYNSTSKETRLYAKGSLTISAVAGEIITKIEFNASINANKNGVAPTIDGVEGATSAGTWDAENWTWTGEDTEVTMSTSGNAGNVGFKSITVTYTAGSAAAVAKPTFTPAGGTYVGVQNVTLACETEGATIYYTTDGNDPTPNSKQYAEAIVVNQTTTIKAIAVKGTDESKVAEATYTILPKISNPKEQPYSVAQALDLISQYQSDPDVLSNENNKVYVKGTVTDVPEQTNTYTTQDYALTDGAVTLKVFRGLNLNETDLTYDAIKALEGKTVVVYGNLKDYVQGQGDAQTHTSELDRGNYIVSVETPINSMAIVGDFLGLDATGATNDPNWDPANGWQMTKSTENPAIWTLTVEGFEAEAKTYYYKATANEKWGDYELPAEGNQNFVFGTDEYPAGKYNLTFTADTEKHTLDIDVEPELALGDVNGDTEVTTTDAVMAVDFALGKSVPTTAQFNAANVVKAAAGEEEAITVADAIGIVNIAIGKSNDDPAAGARLFDEGNNFLTLNGKTLSLTNTTAFAGFQMDVTLAEGAQFNGAQLTERASGLKLVCNRISENTWRIIALSLQGNTISGSNGALLTLDIMGNSTVSVSNIEFADAEANAYALGFGGATGINGVYGVSADSDIYNVNGVRTNTTHKGMNIIRNANGEVKKVFVK